MRDPKVELLRAMPMLAAFQDRQLVQIAPLMDEVNVAAGTVLTREGTPGTETFLIVDGEADVTLRGARLAVVGPGEFVGEMALIDHNPRSATVTAITDLHVFSISARSLASLLQQPGVLRRMLAVMTRRLRDCENAPSYDRPGSGGVVLPTPYPGEGTGGT